MKTIFASLALTALMFGTFVVPEASTQTRPAAVKPASAKYPAAVKTGQTETHLAPVSSLQEIPAPVGSGSFGAQIMTLPNGNIVVTDNLYDITTPSTIMDVGAVYLYNGETLELISMVTGSQTGDQVGSAGLVLLENGNYLIRSHMWDNGAVVNAGAVTWGSAATGVSGVVSAANSLVGSFSSDNVGSIIPVALTNGNYVVRCQACDSGGITDSGAVTWGDGTNGTFGAITAANSMVGSTVNDFVGNAGVTALPNGNYVSINISWGPTDVGAVFWGNGLGGTVGTLSSANALVGSAASDQVGLNGVVVLANGNYLVKSERWDGAATDVGAVTWGNGAAGTSGAVSAANSLVGSTADDRVGSTGTGGGIQVLPNGNYTVSSPSWDKLGILNVGAVTWGNGAVGTSGVVSPLNSLVGSTADDLVGYGSSQNGVTALTNGNYTVNSYNWDNGAITDAGAVTWCNGSGGTVGAVTMANSLVGGTAADYVGVRGTIALTNGNYVVGSPNWGLTDLGAVTWGNGAGGTAGVVDAANSLVGSTSADGVGSNNPVALANGNYVVLAPSWDNGPITNAGAVAWGNGNGGTVGIVSPANALVGSAANDNVGASVTALPNGNYVAATPLWNNGTGTDAGAATWGSGVTGISGPVSASNSLVGSRTSDGSALAVVVLTNSNYVLRIPNWDSAAAANVGAAVWGNGAGGLAGTVSASNALVGTAISDTVGANVQALPNGHYVVNSPGWDGSLLNLGAVTWGNGWTGISGPVSAANSLVGSTAGDSVGNSGVTVQTNSNYVVYSSSWDNGTIVNGRAVTYGAGNGGTVGPITADNSVLGGIGSENFRFVQPANAQTAKERFVTGLISSKKIAVFNPAYAAVSDGNWDEAATWNFGTFIEAHNVVIPAPRAVTLNTNITGGGNVTVASGGSLINSGNYTSAAEITNHSIVDLSLGTLDMGDNVLSIGCGGTVNGAGSSGYIIGSVKKAFCSAETFSFPVGTARGYAPVDVNVTSAALMGVASSLEVSSTETSAPGLFSAGSLQRFWTLTETGNLTADMTFGYVDDDVMGTESSYGTYRIVGGVPELISPQTFDPSANRMAVANIDEFGIFGIGSLGPTAAGVTISGRVLNSYGGGLGKATVRLADSAGRVQTAITSPFGYYEFTDVEVGTTYIVGVESKRFRYAPRVLALTDEVTGLDFTPEP